MWIQAEKREMGGRFERLSRDESEKHLQHPAPENHRTVPVLYFMFVCCNVCMSVRVSWTHLHAVRTSIVLCCRRGRNQFELLMMAAAKKMSYYSISCDELLEIRWWEIFLPERNKKTCLDQCVFAEFQKILVFWSFRETRAGLVEKLSWQVHVCPWHLIRVRRRKDSRGGDWFHSCLIVYFFYDSF